MNWINILYHSNQKYIVQEKAIIDAIDYLFSEKPYVKLVNSPRLIFDKEHLNLEISLDVKINTSQSQGAFEIIKDLSRSVEKAIKNLINKNPKNVQICLLDFN
ncbi:MMB_0454 family protein [Mycoplasmopsis sturni]|uniref:MMB_0454 family protein n=1 Tax=Mycoplasmopsis sturni TaxID=39047 RepID=UPI00068D1659|nr:hypothetical protein [Mycoplasmopsis sturni]